MTARRTAAAVAPKLNITGDTILAAASAAATKDPTTAKKATANRRRSTPAEKLETTVRAGAARAAGTRKPRTATPAKDPVQRAAAKKAVPAHVIKQAADVKKMVPAKKVAKPAKAETKQAPEFEARDWTFLQEKDPSDLHVTFAQQITMRSDVEITAKQVQAVMAMHPSFQRSRTNKARPTYAALDPEIVEQRSVHMVLAHKDARDKIAARGDQPKKAAAKKTVAKRVAKKTAAKK